eukprot:gnl/MRDRNA2_/MRDRNA2_107622_c0_seq1.p1 gnl/MRDRNA2_/MRDRNA2_107622_c0~~gnl/MRDRNA2_/MRDRNA2_107622_c0_seq1.p1  ORF type:complete len:756 (-),score=81.69 gnl/MRDRNA2_/MRDRNA2_107622_c0_seq1:376-2388(-)
MFPKKVQNICWGSFGSIGHYVPTIHPGSNVLQCWMIVCLVFAAYSFMCIPYRVMFDAPAKGLLFVFEEGLINTVFLVDMLAAFFTGFYEISADDEDFLRLVLDVRGIGRRYLRSWFLIDLLSSIPFTWFMRRDAFFKSGLGVWPFFHVLRMLRVARGFRFAHQLRAVRVANVQTWMDVIESAVEAKPSRIFAWTLLQIIGFLMIVTHLNACIWYAVGLANADAFPPLPDGTPSSWIQRFIPEYVTKPQEKYVYALHFVLATITSVGYGDISPTNLNEHIFTLFLLVTGAVIFASVLTVLNSLIAQLFTAANAKRIAVQQLIKYMQWRGLPLMLQKNIRQYFLYVWENDKEFAHTEKQILGSLSPFLQAEVSYSVYGQVLHAAPFFQWMFFANQTALKSLALKCKSLFFVTGDIIFDYDQVHKMIYFLLSGRLQVELYSEGEQHDVAAVERQRVGSSGRSSPRILLKRSHSKDSTYSWSNSSVGSGSEPCSPRLSPRVLRNSTVQFACHNIPFWKDAVKQAETFINEKQQRLKVRKSRKQGSGSKQIPSHSSPYPVEGPAFFGESCLWHEDSHDFRQAYRLSCLKRSECVALERADVLEVIDKYPKVRVRYEMFCKAMFASARKKPGLIERQGSACSTREDLACRSTNKPKKESSEVHQGNTTLRETHAQL